jgi:hypothetical protein
MTKTNKKANNKVVAEPASQKEPVLSVWSFLSLFCLEGLTVQFFFTMKIVLVDKEIATLALSLVFFLIFVIGYFAFLRKSKMNRLLLIISGSLLLVTNLVLVVVYLCLGEKAWNVIFYGLSSLLISSVFPLVDYWLTYPPLAQSRHLVGATSKEKKK